MRINKAPLFRFGRHLAFWVVSFLILLRIFSRGDGVMIIDIIYTFLFHIPLVAMMLFHSVILRKSFDEGKYYAYAFQLVFLIFFLIHAYELTFEVVSDLLFPEFYFVAVYRMHEIAGIGLAYVGISLLLHLSVRWYEQQEEMKAIHELKEQKRNAELQALRAQINPHFLFNILNTLYGQALRKAKNTPELILKLSDMLRYVVDNSPKEEVFVSEEIGYLRNYIELQKERYNRPELIQFEVHGDPKQKQIAPLILINFVENAFKHGKLNADDDFIRITLSINYKKLKFSVSNTFGETSDLPELQKSGTGLANTKRRLELRYPDKYQLREESSDRVYSVTLTLNFQSDALPYS